MKRTSTRLCALCDTVIPDTFIVCQLHFKDYLMYKNDEWFKELVMAQRRQFEIDNMESLLGIARSIKPYQKLTESQKQGIKFLRSKGLGAKNISKVLGIPTQTIEHYLYPRSTKNKGSG